MVLEYHIDIHQPKEQKKKIVIISTTLMNKKKQQLGEDIQQLGKVIQSKAPRNYTLIFNNLLLNCIVLFCSGTHVFHLSYNWT